MVKLSRELEEAHDQLNQTSAPRGEFDSEELLQSREELARLEGEILADSSVDCAFSGTTVAFAAVRRNQVFWCNVGDSRITLGVLCDGVVRASA